MTLTLGQAALPRDARKDVDSSGHDHTTPSGHDHTTPSNSQGTEALVPSTAE